MVEQLYTGLVDIDKLQLIAANCHFTQEALFLAEQLPSRLITSPKERFDLLKFTYVGDSPLCTEYSSGRIFQQDRELRWERQANKVRVVYLGPVEGGLDLHAYGLEEKKEFGEFIRRTEPTYYYLFGERIRPGDLEKIGNVARSGDFAVLRIHRILRYPVKEDGRRYVRLAVCDYLEKITNRVVLFRFQVVETLEGKLYESI